MVLASYHTREVNGDFNAKIAKIAKQNWLAATSF